MKKYLSNLFFVLIITILFVGCTFFAPAPINAQSMTISQFVEFLIVIGVIAPDKAVIARNAINKPITATPAPEVNRSTETKSYIQVLEPNGKESWEIDLDLPYHITWGSSGLKQVRVALVNGRNVLCNLTQNPVSSNDGEHELAVLLKNAKCYNLSTGSTTDLLSGAYRVRVYNAVGNNTIQDDSDSTFKILPKPVPSLKVTFPNGGENLARNRDIDVKYTLKNVNNSTDGLIYLYLLDINGYSVYNYHQLMRNGKYTLDLPSSLSPGAYKIKLKLTTREDKIEIEDSSDNFFWISTGL